MNDIDDHVTEPAGSPRVDDEREWLSGHGTVSVQQLNAIKNDTVKLFSQQNDIILI